MHMRRLNSGFGIVSRMTGGVTLSSRQLRKQQVWLGKIGMFERSMQQLWDEGDVAALGACSEIASGSLTRWGRTSRSSVH